MGLLFSIPVANMNCVIASCSSQSFLQLFLLQYWYYWRFSRRLELFSFQKPGTANPAGSGTLCRQIFYHRPVLAKPGRDVSQSRPCPPVRSLPFTSPPEELETCLSVLQRVADAHGTIPRSDRFNGLIAKVYREGKRHGVHAERRRQESEDRAVQATTAMVQIQRDALPAETALLTAPAGAPTGRTLNQPEACYVCKRDYTEVHFFYHLLCPECAAFNYAMRGLHADLSGRTALVTGGRVKIGFQTVLRLLRDGAKVLVTTRFPHAAARRFHAEPDSTDWADRLHCYGLDLRNIPAVEAFAHHLRDTEPHLDILIHNAAQTIRRPPGFYGELVSQEQNPQETLSADARRLVAQGAPSTLAISDSSLLLPAVLPGVADVLPPDAWEDNEERADSRSVNSWLLRLDEVSAPEMLEVQLVNSVAPFLLKQPPEAAAAAPRRSRARFIVNVSAVEGQFARHKTVFHPHTNMAKAALNMMTRTSGEDYAQGGIYMTSVDTGWVTDENPGPRRARNQDELGFFRALGHHRRHGPHLPPHRPGPQRPRRTPVGRVPQGLPALPLVTIERHEKAARQSLCRAAFSAESARLSSFLSRFRTFRFGSGRAGRPGRTVCPTGNRRRRAGERALRPQPCPCGRACRSSWR